MGIAPTGKRVEVRAFTLHRFSGGKIAEDWARYDTLDVVRQLGVIPDRGGSKGLRASVLTSQPMGRGFSCS